MVVENKEQKKEMEELMAELEKVKQQVDYYRTEIDTINRLYEKERTDHWDTKKTSLNFFLTIYSTFQQMLNTSNKIQRNVSGEMGDMIKMITAIEQFNANLTPIVSNLKKEVDTYNESVKKGQPQQSK